MKQLFTVFAMICLLTSACGGKKSGIDPFASMAGRADSAHHALDAVDVESVAENPDSMETNELFDEFIFKFASDETMQRKRILFPLSYCKNDSTSKIEKGTWKHDYLFAKQTYYTLLFDRESDMDLVEDTTLSSVQVEWYFLHPRSVKRYYFERKSKVWELEAINQCDMKKNNNKDFVSFYTRFATDSLFQIQHICDPLQYITIDPDDEFAILETTIDASQWDAFKSVIPTDKLSNINYGQKNEDNSSTKMLKINGIDNGYSVVYYFRKRNGAWELYKFEDTST